MCQSAIFVVLFGVLLLNYCCPGQSVISNGTNGYVDRLRYFFNNTHGHNHNDNTTKLHVIESILHTFSSDGVVTGCLDVDRSCSKKCEQLSDVALESSINFQDDCPQLLYYISQSCLIVDDSHDLSRNKSDTDAVHSKPPYEQVWSYGFLLVTLINLCSLAGVFVLPLMNKSFYGNLLLFLVALAVGSLSSSSVLVLIPEGFEVVDKEGYLWRGVCVLVGLYFFFVTERLLKIISSHCTPEENVYLKEGDQLVTSIPLQTYVQVDRAAPMADEPSESKVNLVATDSTTISPGLEGADAIRGHSHKPVATVAWMIIFGDAFHNFVDGLSIGAAFSESILLGVSICIAVLCEELPHELGDFAILLHAGMSKRKALLFNFLSACTCYLGLVIGITLAEVAHATPWILCIAGGMFLYIALADMVPEMNHSAEEMKDQPVKVFVIQNFGLLFGFGVMLIVSRFGGEITLS